MLIVFKLRVYVICLLTVVYTANRAKRAEAGKPSHGSMYVAKLQYINLADVVVFIFIKLKIV
jgi:hypothetical protein